MVVVRPVVALRDDERARERVAGGAVVVERRARVGDRAQRLGGLEAELSVLALADRQCAGREAALPAVVARVARGGGEV